MVETKTPYHTPGKGGTRRGYVAKNEIEDMTLFDEYPGKSPSPEENPAGSKTIDGKGMRKQK